MCTRLVNRSLRSVYCALLSIISFAGLTQAEAQSKHVMSVAGICRGHEVRFGANLEKSPGLRSLKLTNDDQQNMMRLPYVVLLNALRSLGQNAIPEFFETHESVVGAADDFSHQSGDDLGMVHFTSVYIATPRLDKPDWFASNLAGASKIAGDGVIVFSWREVSERASEVYFAVSLADGTAVLSNEKAALMKTVRELERPNEDACPTAVRELTSKSYWLFREKHSNHPIPVGDPSFQEQIDWISLSIDDLRRTTIDVHGRFRADIPEPSMGNLLNFQRIGSDYVATIESLSDPKPNRWLGILALFGYEIFV